MPRRNPDASSTVIAANLGWISSGLEAWGGERKKTQTSLSPPYAQRISCDSRFATAGEGGSGGWWWAGEGEREGGGAPRPAGGQPPRRARLPCGDSPARGPRMPALGRAAPRSLLLLL